MDNNALEVLASAAPKSILKAIHKASASTGVDFAYLMGKAAAESSFNPKAKARTSSATGLYQFVDKTWLSMVRKYGDKYGLGKYAARIDDSGRVKSSAMRREILALRRDPEKSALLAAEFARENKRLLDQTWGGKVGATELYLAHFMGAGGAAAFLKAHDDNPLQSGADLFPQAALSNRNVFYNSKTGRERSLAEIYAFFDRKFEAAEGHTVVQEPHFPGLGASGDMPPSLSGDLELLATDMQDPDEEKARSWAQAEPLTGRVRRETITWNSERVQPGAIPGAGPPLFSPVDIMLMARPEDARDQREAVARYAYND